jgi:hypothetical protein
MLNLAYVREARKECRLCAGNTWLGIEETGEPLVSLHNAHALLDRRGAPTRARFHYANPSWEGVSLYWDDHGLCHQFIGFSWSSPSLSGHSLFQCLRMLGLPNELVIDWPPADPSFAPREFTRTVEGWVPAQ